MASILSAGTTSSTAMVHTADTSGVLQLASNNGTVGVTLDTSQNVGIGIASPTRQLTVYGPQSYIALQNSTTGATSGDGLQIQAAGADAYIWNYENSFMSFGTNASERMRIDSSGTAIVNSTSAGRGDKLTVVGAGTLSTVTSSVRGLLAVESDTATAQNVGGAISLGGNYDGGRTQYGAIGGFKESSTSSEYGGYLAFFTRPNGDLTKERMRIRSDGALLVGTTIEPTSVYNGFKTDVSYTIISAASATCLYVNRNTTTGEVVQIRYNNGGVGSISTNGSNTTYGTSSDYRLKENIAPMTGALDTVAQLKPVTYKWKSTGEESQGFIAHELAEVVPDCVTGEKDATEVVDIKDEEGNVIGQEIKPKYQNIDTSFLVATLTAAIQELNAKVEALQAKVGA